MINNAEELALFKSFLGAGGLSEVGNLTKGKSLRASASDQSSKLASTINSEITDYQEATNFVANIQSIVVELNDAANALSSFNDYLSITTDPTDLEQVSIGVSVKQKVEGVEDDSPAPSIYPITSKVELETMELALNALIASVADVPALMSVINAELEPIEDSGSGSGGMLPPPPPPELSDATKQKIIEANNKLTPVIGTVRPCAIVIAEMVALAIRERSEALALFQQAISFTISSGQLKKPSISAAAMEMYPK